jgi:hypothetical protein
MTGVSRRRSRVRVPSLPSNSLQIAREIAASASASATLPSTVETVASAFTALIVRSAAAIFAIRCALYRLLTGEYPFASIPDIQNWVAPTEPQRLNAQIPLSLRSVVRKSLERDRKSLRRRTSNERGARRLRDQELLDPGSRRRDHRDMACGDSGWNLRAAQYPSRGRALQARRTLLVRVVEGERPR